MSISIEKNFENIFKEDKEDGARFFIFPLLFILSKNQVDDEYFWMHIGFKNTYEKYLTGEKIHQDIFILDEYLKPPFEDSFDKHGNNYNTSHAITHKLSKNAKWLREYLDFVFIYKKSKKIDYPKTENDFKTAGTEAPLVRIKPSKLLNVKNSVNNMWKTEINQNNILAMIFQHKEYMNKVPGGKNMPNNPLNQILYGPPGTGKTHKLQTEYLDKCEDYKFITFHQSYAYEEFIEGIKPKAGNCKNNDDKDISYCIKNGIFKEACEEALKLTKYNEGIDGFCKLTKEERKDYFKKDTPKYAILIDEINRGNISKIFGELITLIEKSKRLGADDEIILTLPYSNEKFAIPSNLYIIGTMNTADRSIAHIDTALRRRFEFVEMMPKTSDDDKELDFKVNNVHIRSLLKAMNERIEVLYDREHTIGHAYFIDLTKDSTVDDLAHIFKNKVIPLLAEYFYSDWSKIDLVLNKNGFIKKDSRTVGKIEKDIYSIDDEALNSSTNYEIIAEKTKVDDNN